jgi:hypothetical protein
MDGYLRVCGSVIHLTSSHGDQHVYVLYWPLYVHAELHRHLHVYLHPFISRVTAMRSAPAPTVVGRITGSEEPRTSASCHRRNRPPPPPPTPPQKKTRMPYVAVHARQRSLGVRKTSVSSLSLQPRIKQTLAAAPARASRIHMGAWIGGVK